MDYIQITPVAFTREFESFPGKWHGWVERCKNYEGLDTLEMGYARLLMCSSRTVF